MKIVTMKMRVKKESTRTQSGLCNDNISDSSKGSLRSVDHSSDPHRFLSAYQTLLSAPSLIVCFCSRVHFPTFHIYPTSPLKALHLAWDMVGLEITLAHLIGDVM